MTHGGSADRFSAAVLAGGASRRMGTDKAFVPWNGTTLLNHQLATLRGLRPAELLISGRHGVDYAVPDARVVLDEHVDAGPMAGVLSLLLAMRNELLVVVAVDMPFVTAGYFREVLAIARGGRAVVPRVNERWEPFAAIYPRAMAELFAQRIASGVRSLQSLLDAAQADGRVEPFVSHDDALFESLNTPERLSRHAENG